MDTLRLDSFIAIRHHLHQHPEIEGDTVQTSQLVADHLSAYGYKVHRHIGGHGLVAVLRRGTGTKSLGIRADMDALPIHEQNNFAHASKIAGRMHACGHDGHTTILLAAAKQIAQHCDFNGTLNLIFQPAEENLTGAKAMLEAGLFEQFPCDAIYALHNLPGIPVGTAIVQAGTVMASSQRVLCKIIGKGGHGAMPEHTHDPIQALSAFINAIQSIKSRNLNVQEYAVISIGSIHAGATYNVIPNEVELQLSIRTDTQAVLNKINHRMVQIVRGIELSCNVHISLVFDYLVPPVINSSAETLLLEQALADEDSGINVVPQTTTMMASEDFAWMLAQRPGCYFFLGNGEGEPYGCSIHNAHYDFNDQNIVLGAHCWTLLVEKYLN